MAGHAHGHIQVCEVNRLAQSPKLLERLTKLGYRVQIEPCLDQCTRCHFTAFGLVSGCFRFAPTSAEFFAKLR